MQYLLTAEEFNALEPTDRATALAADKAVMSRMIAKLTVGHCIHDPHPTVAGRTVGGYCDMCGMAGLMNDSPRCPFQRNFSK